MDLSFFQICSFVTLIVLVLALPLSVQKIEENLEIFLFVCGIAAVSIAQLWSGRLVLTALKDPLKITAAVFLAGLLFRRYHASLGRVTHQLGRAIGWKSAIFLIVFVLGITSSVITAIIAALVLSEIAVVLPLNKKNRIKFIVYGCYAIGLGAVLTAIGEPLGTVVISKLHGEPYHATFFFLIQHLGWYVLAGTLIMAGLCTRLPLDEQQDNHASLAHEQAEYSFKSIVLRAGKIYLFVMALVFLGDGLKPLALKVIAPLSHNALYFINILSAVLDNATLAAIEITPSISEVSLTFLLISLIISGGMLIPGNIPNIICASKLKIKSKEWARTALPLGAVLLVGYFVVLTFVFTI